MAQMLLINPGKIVTKRKKTRTAAQKRATAKMIAANRSRRAARKTPRRTKARRARRANPSPLATYRRVSRRRSTVGRVARRVRRRRNPISLGRASGIVGMFKDAMIEGAGAVAVDVGYGYVNRMLPPSMQSTPGALNAGTAVKALITAVAGKFLGRYTKGLALKAARGSLTVQARDAIAGMLPAGMVGWRTAAPVLDMSARVGPSLTGAQVGRVGAYTAPGQTALLNGRVGAYAPPGVSALLNGARTREGWANRK